MPKKLDLTGQRFGRLYVLQPAPNKNGKTRWLCQCDCGKQKIVGTDSLRTGKTLSCGCLHKQLLIKRNKEGIKDLTGQRFGHLQVIKYAGYSIRGHAAWTCQCDCGVQKDISGADLQKGDITSCGCQRYTSYGELAIKEILINNSIKYKTQYWFDDLRSEANIPLRFDFAILDKNNNLLRLIEYDGEQHYLQKANKFFKADTLQHRKITDTIKNNYCLQHNIPLVRIPYWEKKNISFELLFGEKFLIKKEEEK